MKKLLMLSLLLAAVPAMATNNNIYNIHTDTLTVQNAIVWPDGSVQVSSPSAGGGSFSVTPSTMVILPVTSEVTISSDVYQPIGLAVNFAASDSTHKVKLTFTADASGTNLSVTIFKDGVDLDLFGLGLSNSTGQEMISMIYLDAVGDTSAHVYEVKSRTAAAGASDIPSNGQAVLVIEEVQ